MSLEKGLNLLDRKNEPVSPLWKKKERYSAVLFLLPTALFLGFTSLYPLLYSLVLSLNDYDLRLGPFLTFIWFKNYVTLFQDTYFLNSLLRTLVFVIVTVTIETVSGMVLALLLTRERRHLRIARSLILIPMIMTPVVIGVLWRMLLNPDYGLVNYLINLLGGKSQSWLGSPHLAFLSVMAVDVWEWTPFLALSFISGITALPNSAREAALVDGASGWQIFWQISLPMLRPVVVVSILLRLLDAFKVVDTVYVMTGGGPGDATKLLSLFIYEVGLKYFNVGYASAASWIFILIMLLLNSYFIRERGRAI